MATNNGRGVPQLPSTLIRPTTPKLAEDRDDQPELEEAAEPVESGRGDARAAVPARPRRRKPAAPIEKTTKRGLYLTDAVWERLQLEAIRKKSNASVIANDVLDRNLLRLRIEREA